VSRDPARRPSFRTWLVLGAVALVAAAASLDALRRAPSTPATARPAENTRLDGPLLPPLGELTGEVVFTSLAGCSPQTLQLETLTLELRGPSLQCRLWVPPRGDLAAVSLAPALGFRGSRMGLLRLGKEPTVVRALGVARGDPAWSDDGERLAWCTPEGDIVVLTVETGARAHVEGCRPTITPDGSVLTRPASGLAATLLRDGEILLDERRLAQAFPAGSEGPLDLVGYDVRADGLLAAVAVRFESGRRPRRLLQLWRAGMLEKAILLPELTLPAGTGRLGERVEFDPSGREVAVSYSGPGKQMVLVDVRSGRITLDPVNQYGFAWSPDGSWFALSTGEEVRVLGPQRRDPVYVLPIGAAALAWR
jgi:hypothetical protein